MRTDSATVDVDDRIRRWYTVVERVEERFTERLAELQEKVQWWYLSVRELEVQEVRCFAFPYFIVHLAIPH